MKLLDKVLITIILVCVSFTIFCFLYYPNKTNQLLNSLEKVKSENEVLKKALENPKVVVKPTVRYIRQVEYITAKDTDTVKPVSWGSYGQNWGKPLKPEFHEIVTEIIEVEGGRTTEPVIPEKKEQRYLEQPKKFNLLTQYCFDKNFSLGLGYNLFQNIAVGISINTDEKLSIWTVWRF